MLLTQAISIVGTMSASQSAAMRNIAAAISRFRVGVDVLAGADAVAVLKIFPMAYNERLSQLAYQTN